MTSPCGEDAAVGGLRRRLVLLLWLASLLLVAWLSLKPRLRLSPPSSDVDKVYHFLAYCWLSFVPLAGWAGRRRAAFLALLMLPLGLVLELLQRYVPGRSASSLDLLANFLGVAAGFAAHAVLRGLTEVDGKGD